MRPSPFHHAARRRRAVSAGKLIITELRGNVPNTSTVVRLRTLAVLVLGACE